LALRFDTFFDPEDLDYSIFEQRFKSPRSGTSKKKDHRQSFRSKLTQVSYAVVGWFYFEDPKEAMKWGKMFFTPLVTYAHDILIKDPRFATHNPDFSSIDYREASYPVSLTKRRISKLRLSLVLKSLKTIWISFPHFK
jgi:hypothetical protein